MPSWVKWLLFTLAGAALLAADLWWIRWEWERPGSDEGALPYILVAGLLVWIAAGFRTTLKRLAFEPATFEVTPDLVAPGGEVHVVYRQRIRKAVQVPKATLSLVFSETAVKGSGKSRSTHTHSVVVQKVERVGLALEAGADWVFAARLAIPRDAMHSFEADSNTIGWGVTFAAEVQGWPDLDEGFALEVAPPGRKDEDA